MSKTDKRREPGDPIEALLPWYAAGTLDETESGKVEAWLRETPDGARRLTLVRDEQDAAIGASEALGAPSPGSLDRLMRSLPGTTRRNATAKAGGWLAGIFGGAAAPSYRLAAMAAALLIVAQAGALTLLMTRDQSGGGYRAASGDSQPNAAGTRALVRFSDSATVEQISAFLESAGVQIVGGPKPGGVYIVLVSPQNLNEAELSAKLKELLTTGAIVTFTSPLE